MIDFMEHNTGLVQLPALADELGISPQVRRLMIEQELVTPMRAVRRGSPTRITREDAEDIRRAWAVSASSGISVITVLRVVRALAPDMAPNMGKKVSDLH